MDIDWAPDEVVESCVSEITRRDLKVTLFCTDFRSDISGMSSSLRNKFNEDLVEIALHPKFETNISVYATLFNLKNVYPLAKGVRSHNLHSAVEILSAMKKLKLKYDSSIQLSFQAIQPYLFLDYAMDIIECPIYFMDTLYLMRKQRAFNPEAILPASAPAGIPLTFDFHPILIYMNASSNRFYALNKQFYHNPIKLKKNRYSGKGIGTLFLSFLDYLIKNQIETALMSEIAKKRLKIFDFKINSVGTFLYGGGNR
jgi:hypothetical protein